MNCCELHKDGKYKKWPCGKYSKELRHLKHESLKDKCPDCGGIKSHYAPRCIKCTRKIMGERRKGKSLSKKWKENISKGQMGSKGNNWQGGKTKKNKRLRESARFKDWRKKVFERDSFTCQDCGERGGILHPHHIKLFSEFPKLRFSVDNGITLCAKCHQKRHTKTKLSVI